MRHQLHPLRHMAGGGKCAPVGKSYESSRAQNWCVRERTCWVSVRQTPGCASIYVQCALVTALGGFGGSNAGGVGAGVVPADQACCELAHAALHLRHGMAQLPIG